MFSMRRVRTYASAIARLSYPGLPVQGSPFMNVEQLFYGTPSNACFRSQALKVIPKLPQTQKFSLNVKLHFDKNTFQKIGTMVSRFGALPLFNQTAVTTTLHK